MGPPVKESNKHVVTVRDTLAARELIHREQRCVAAKMLLTPARPSSRALTARRPRASRIRAQSNDKYWDRDCDAPQWVKREEPLRAGVPEAPVPARPTNELVRTARGLAVRPRRRPRAPCARRSASFARPRQLTSTRAFMRGRAARGSSGGASRALSQRYSRRL